MQDKEGIHESRIVLANEPRLLRELLSRVLRRTPRLDLVGEAADAGSASGLVRELGAEWLVVALSNDGSFPAASDAIMAANPALSVVGLARDGGTATARSGMAQRQMDGLSLDDLIGLLQSRRIEELPAPVALPALTTAHAIS